jgi:WIF domain
MLLVRHLDECFNLCVCFAAGLGAELYYIRDGVLNQYALKFNVPIPANVSDLNFTWRSLTTRTVSVSLSLFCFSYLRCALEIYSSNSPPRVVPYQPEHEART